MHWRKRISCALRDDAGADFGATCNRALLSPANVDAAMISKNRYLLIAAAAMLIICAALSGTIIEAENARLRKAVSDLTLDKMILAEAARGNF
jgi:hypothetical protein